VFRAIEEVLASFDGRPHWGKVHTKTAETLRPLYPDWDRFQAVRARLDPDGRFRSAYLDRVLGPVREVVGAIGEGGAAALEGRRLTQFPWGR
jgi:L-gulonolactone oxidase